MKSSSHSLGDEAAAELQRRAEDLAAIYEVSRDLAAQIDVASLLDTLLNRVMTLLGNSSATVFLYDHERRDVEVAATRRGTLQPGMRFALNEGIIGRVVATGLPMVVDDYQTWEHRLPALAAQGVRAILMVPMTTGGERIGALGVSEYTADRIYTESDAHLLSLFAAHAASALCCVQRLEKERERASELLLENQERQRVEVALRESEERYRSLVEDMNDVVFTMGFDGVITYISPAIRQLTGHAAETLTGRPFAVFVHPEDVAILRDALERVLQDRRDPVEFRVFSASGETRWVRSSSRRNLVNGIAVGITGSLTDITERKRAAQEIHMLNEALEQRVQERTAELAAANHELEAFGYSVAHDLRGPLRIIEGFSRLLLDEYAKELNEVGRDYLENVRASSTRMAQLIQALLDLSRVTRSAIERQPVDLAVTARVVAEDLRQSQPERRVRFVIPARAPASGDPSMLSIVVENLLGNAWKYTGSRTEATIELGCRERDGEAVYFVRDDGAGFDMKYAGKLFEPFQRLHGVSEFEGTGIGLATVERIVRRHGGRVWAESAVDRGATFFFTLAPPKAT